MQNGDTPTPRNCQGWFLRQFSTPEEEARFNSRRSYPHAHPGSVFIANIGAMWEPGCWQKVMDMVMYTSRQGHQAWFEEVLPAQGDVLPMADIGYMRDTAVMKALDAGLEYICLIDSDVQPEKDALVKLLDHELTLVAPYLVEPGVGQLGDPKWDAKTGLRRMRWVCASFLVFRPTIFNCPGVFFRSTRDDDLFFQQLWHYGIFPILDTDIEVVSTRPPRRYGGRGWEERWDLMSTIYNKSGETPDRSPIDPNDPNTIDGVYSPIPVLGEQNG